MRVMTQHTATGFHIGLHDCGFEVLNLSRQAGPLQLGCLDVVLGQGPPLGVTPLLVTQQLLHSLHANKVVVLCLHKLWLCLEGVARCTAVSCWAKLSNEYSVRQNVQYCNLRKPIQGMGFLNAQC